MTILIFSLYLCWCDRMCVVMRTHGCCYSTTLPEFYSKLDWWLEDKDHLDNERGVFGVCVC